MIHRWTLRRLVAAGTIAILPTLAYSAPNITSVDTSQMSKNLVTIKGSGFGSGPTVDVHDNFEHAGAQFGQPVDPNQAITNSWIIPERAPTYDNIAVSGKFSANMWNPLDGRAAQLQRRFTQPRQSIYLSYWIQIPTGYPFPGKDAAYSGFSTESSWKFSWLIDQDYWGGSSDVCIPNHTGKGHPKLAGNDFNLDWGLQTMDTWWSWGNWVRISAWLWADPANPTTNGRAVFTTWSLEHGFYIYDKNHRVFDADGPATKQYQYFNIPGWISEFQGNNGRPLYDDIYVASGPNAVARLELTDNSSYKSSTKFAIQKVVSWTDTAITFEVIDANFVDISNTSIHVFDRNNVGSNGAPMGSLAAITPPAAPSAPLAPVLSVTAL